MNKYITIAALFFIIFIPGIFFASRFSSEGTIVSPLPADISFTFPTPTSSRVPSNAKNNTPLTDIVTNALAETIGDYGIVIKNLKTGESYVANEHKAYEAGSLYKLWVMATVFEQVNEGVLHQNDVLSADVANLNKEFSIPPEEAEKTQGSVTFSVEDALWQMIVISDNYAALLLADKVNLSQIAKFLATHGYFESKIGTGGNRPTVTPYDVGRFFERLYTGQLADKESTEKMLELLKNQALNDKLPKYLPDDIVVAHKTGELGAFTHDAGIVYTQTGDYIIVILSESEDPTQAKERIAKVSQAVYTYFTK